MTIRKPVNSRYPSPPLRRAMVPKIECLLIAPLFDVVTISSLTMAQQLYELIRKHPRMIPPFSRMFVTPPVLRSMLLAEE